MVVSSEEQAGWEACYSQLKACRLHKSFRHGFFRSILRRVPVPGKGQTWETAFSLPKSDPVEQ
jgi:hypothetical protein